MQDLEGKVAVVTGAGRPLGIGRGCALRLAERGADVVVSDICRQYEGDMAFYSLGEWEQLQKAVGEIEALGRKGLAFKVDVTIKDEVQAMVDETIKHWGRIDILVNNAGTGVGVGPFLDINEEAWDKTFDVNVKGTFYCCRAVIPHMIEQGGGKIINISSTAGLRGAAQYGAYVPSKFAVVGLTELLAAEFAPQKINVNAVCPAMVDTDLGIAEYHFLAAVQGSTFEEVREATRKSIPLGRAATADDIADVVAFLASPQSDYMVGQSIAVTGGMEFSH